MSNWFRIKPAKRFVMHQGFKVDSTYIKPQLINHPEGQSTVNNFRLVNIDGQPYYQTEKDNFYNYYNAKTGAHLPNGDNIYAKQLARYFLGDKTSGIERVERIDEFTSEYKVINRLLPAYKVSFKRDDGMDVYVHTPSSRLGTLNNSFRKGYMWFFSMFHNWNFLGQGHSVLKTTVVFVFSVLVFVAGSLGLGIYVVNRKKFKARKAKSDKLKPRNRHRKLSVAASLFLLLFAFSGAYHAFQKYEPYVLHTLKPKQNIRLSELSSFNNLKVSKPIHSLSLVQIDNDTYYRVRYSGKKGRTDYIHTKTLTPLENGNIQYAINRAVEVSGGKKDKITQTEIITKFGDEYGFINKRLPVVKVDFDTYDNLSTYIETSSGIPGAIIRDKNRYEGLSFAFMHKYHMFDFLGKGIRDSIMALATFLVVLIALTGLVVFMRMKKRI